MRSCLVLWLLGILDNWFEDCCVNIVRWHENFTKWRIWQHNCINRATQIDDSINVKSHLCDREMEKAMLIGEKALHFPK